MTQSNPKLFTGAPESEASQSTVAHSKALGKAGAYMPQLDGLRAIAVFFVMISHWIRPSIPIGYWGVGLFFTLSGYLITGILLEQRSRADLESASYARIIKNFFINRALRLMPVYYLVLFATIALGLPGMAEDFWWFFTYTTNFLMAAEGAWIGNGTHLWSLAVEEQFYAIWIWVVLFVPKKWLAHALCIAIALATCARGGFFLIEANPFYANTMLVSQMDLLAFGGFLAWAKHTGCYGERFEFFANQRWLFLLVFPALWAISQLPSSVPFSGLLYAIVFGWIIHSCGTGIKDTLGWCLTRPWLLYLGKISYGLYLIHGFVPGLLMKLPIFWQVQNLSISLQFPIYVAVTVVISSLSWKLLESPINGLKKRT